MLSIFKKKLQDYFLSNIFMSLIINIKGLNNLIDIFYILEFLLKFYLLIYILNIISINYFHSINIFVCFVHYFFYFTISSLTQNI